LSATRYTREGGHILGGETVRSTHPGFPPYPMPHFETLADALDFDADDITNGALVYYARRADGCIKIGRSINVPARLKALGRHYPGLELIAVESGSWGVEAFRGYQFIEYTAPIVRGVDGGTEWFLPSPELTAQIASLTEVAA
jgi:hypothetical protein